MDAAQPYPLCRHLTHPLAAGSSFPLRTSTAAPTPTHGASAMDGRLARPLTVGASVPPHVSAAAAAASAPPHISAAAPPPPHGASTMDGHYNLCRDFFSQGSASSYAASGSSARTAYLAADEFGLSSQPPPSPFASSSQSAPHMPMENLDLNSQVDSFPHLDIFPNQEQLHAVGARGGRDLPPLHPGGNGIGSHFNPPRASGARSRSGAGSGGRPSQSVRRSLPLGGSDGGGLRGRVPIRAGRGSTSSSSAVDVDHVDSDEEGDDKNDDDPRFQSGQTECKKFEKGNPPFLHLLIEMFQAVAVDGSSSCIPGEQAYDVEGYDASEVSGAAAASPAGSDADMFGKSPMSISSRK